MRAALAAMSSAPQAVARHGKRHRVKPARQAAAEEERGVHQRRLPVDQRAEQRAHQSRRTTEAENRAARRVVGEPADGVLQRDRAEIDRGQRRRGVPHVEPDAHAPDRQQGNGAGFERAEKRDSDDNGRR